MTRSLCLVVTFAVFAMPISTAASWPVAAGGGAVTCHGRIATILGTRGDDSLSGTRRLDVIAGLGGRDEITGGGGGDIICGGRGDDLVQGGAGDDWIAGAEGDDLLMGSDGNDVFVGGVGEDSFDPGRGHNVMWGGPGSDHLESRIPGSSNTFHGGEGDDIFVFGVRDSAYGGPGRDQLGGAIRPGSGHVVSGGAGANTLVSLAITRPAPHERWRTVRLDLARGRIDADGLVSRIAGRWSLLDLWSTSHARSWTILGSHRPEVIEVAYDLSNVGVVLRGRAGADVLRGGEGDDTLYGGPGADVLKGFEGDDRLDGGAAVDHASAGKGIDTCVSIEAPIAGHSDTGCEVSTP